MVLAAITLLPALLGLAGHRLQTRGLLLRLQLRLGRGRDDGTDAAVLRWSRWGAHVSRHAAAYAVAGTMLLLALAAPVLALRLGLPDQGSYPEARTERRAYDLVAEGFGPGATGPMVVAVDVSRDRSVVEPLVSALAADPGIASAAAAPMEATSDVAVIIAQPTTTPQDAATARTLDRVRSEVLPAALATSPATAHVGGYTATMSDLSQRVEDRLPIFLVAVVAMSYLLLMVLFRSLLVPLKAAVLNLLSVAAAYGVLVMVFQWGWAASLIGLESTVPIISFIPLFMFAILFGLSMDYEVFLLSRVREEYLRTRDNHAAVVRGIGVTARTISCGAAIMVSVFVGFGFGDDPQLKMLGLGLATAVFIDATLVRLVLVPATMTLLGDANWWLPAWLDRLLPRWDLESSTHNQQGGQQVADDFTPSCRQSRGTASPSALASGPSRRSAELIAHHPPAQGRRGHHLETGVEEDVQQPDRRLVPDHGPAGRRLGGIGLQDAGADLPAVLDGGGGELVHQPLSTEARADDEAGD